MLSKADSDSEQPSFSGRLGSGGDTISGRSLMPRPRPPEFRQRAVELARLRERRVAQIAHDLGTVVLAPGPG